MLALQVLGAVLISAGALAFQGSSQRNKHVLTASLLLSLLGTLLAFEFVVEVSTHLTTRLHTCLWGFQLCTCHALISTFDFDCVAAKHTGGHCFVCGLGNIETLQAADVIQAVNGNVRSAGEQRGKDRLCIGRAVHQELGHRADAAGAEAG